MLCDETSKEIRESVEHIKNTFVVEGDVHSIIFLINESKTQVVISTCHFEFFMWFIL